MEAVDRIRRRIASADPLVIDTLVAIGLAALVCLQLWAFSHGRPEPIGGVVGGPGGGGFFMLRLPRQEPGIGIYAIAALAFLPLAIRRKVPWLALAGSSAFALGYQFLHAPPAFVMAGPMVGIYSVAAYAKRRHAGLVTALVAGLVLAVPAFAFSSEVFWLRESAGAFVMVAAAAFFGVAERNRRQYVAEVEFRAAEAERTREEEAHRRVDEERLRIAREVHDVVAHGLSIVAVQAAAADTLLDSDPARAHESVENIRVTSKQALAELRSMLGVLRTGADGTPLEPAADLSRLETLAAAVRETGLAVTLEADPGMETAAALVSMSAYRIVQESLTNVVRHADASTAEVRVRVDGDELTVEVLDDGTAAHEPEPDSGHGLRGMTERVEALGGRFEAGPRADTPGFRVFAALPMARSTG